MDIRNRRTIEHSLRMDAVDARNRINATYSLSGPHELSHNRKNPPMPERNEIRDRLGALMIELEEVSKYEGV